MSEPIELTTIRNLASELETALHGVDRNLLYYFNKEGFITDDVCDDVLNPRSVLREGEKAGELVRAIKNRVKQEPHKYHLLVDHLMSVGKCYYPIVRKLKEEFKKFEGMNCHSCQSCRISLENHRDLYLSRDLLQLSR